MKKYSFPLNNVLNLREQVLENLKSEHAQILIQVANQERKIEELKEKEKNTNDWLQRQMGEAPMTISEIQECRHYISRLEQERQAAKAELELLKRKEEVKRAEVISAKKDKVSIEKLKEKSQAEYQRAYQKDEEQQIEEFVSNKRLIQLHMEQAE